MWFKRRARAERDLEEEIQFHLSEEARLRADRGMPPDEARESARRDFGNVLLVKEVTRDMWAGAWLDGAFRDIRFGLRLLAGNWAFTALGVATLALGIGAATTIFSVIDNVLFNPFDFDADRIVSIRIQERRGTGPGGRSAFQVPELQAFQANVHAFEAILAGALEDVLYSTTEGSDQFSGGRVSANTFSVLGTPAALGRALEPHDAEPGAAPVFVLAYKTWVEHFGSDPSVIGRNFVLNGVSTTLVGVMGPRFRKLGADLYQPANLDSADPDQGQRYYGLQARLKPGVTTDQAATEILLVAQQLAKITPRNYPTQFTIEVIPLLDGVVGSFRLTLYTFAAAVGLLLLIACVNVANMLLARATAREREMALRASLGATRVRLVRQMLIESLLLAMMGMTLGCVSAYFGIPMLAAAIPRGMIPQQAVLQLNLPALGFSVGIACLTSLACGLVPALRAAGNDLVEPLKDSGKGTAGGFRNRRLGDALVAAEVALSIVLLVCAGLLLRSFVKMQAVDLGFDPENVAAIRIVTPRGQYATAAAKGQLYQDVAARVGAMPGVVGAAVTNSLPPFAPSLEIGVPGRAVGERELASVEMCNESYFRVLNMRLLHGRLLAASDVTSARKVAVINQMLAQRVFGTEAPLGRTVELKGLLHTPKTPLTDAIFEIIGVVANTRNQGVREPSLPEAYIPHTLTAAFERGLVVKTAGPPLAILNSVKREIWSVDRGLAIPQGEAVTNVLDIYNYAPLRFSVLVMAMFAATGLTLVAIGVFSVIAYNVSRRTHEIGIRMALGAARSDVVGMVLQSTLRVIAIGIAGGLSISLIVARVLGAQLFGVAPQDPVTLAAVVGVVVAVGLAATYLPAWHATRVDPMIALRHE